jgi:hypothetical protein
MSLDVITIFASSNIEALLCFHPDTVKRVHYDCCYNCTNSLIGGPSHEFLRHRQYFLHILT